MAGRVRGILEHLLGRRLEATVSDMVSDSELLRRFTTTRDEAAFELLVWRYGAMVLGLCRRAMRDEQLAEDAFQAVFLVLARKAGSIRGSNVGGWLFRVARRVAARATRRRPATLSLPDVPLDPQTAAEEHRELTAILDSEVARLPDRLRSAVILCYLGGHTTEDAARELGCPRGTVLSRLATARKRLAERLTRRGVTLPAISLMVGERTTGRLVSQTVVLAQNPFHIPATTGPALLAESVVRSMAITKLAATCGVVLLATGLTFGVGWVAAGQGSTRTVTAAAEPAAQSSQPAAPSKKDLDARPADKTDLLRKQSDLLAIRIKDLQMRIARELLESDGVDLSVLQSELFSKDRRILLAEGQLKVAVRDLERAMRAHEDLTKTSLNANDVLTLIEEQLQVRDVMTRVRKAESNFKDLKLKFGAEHPVLVAANKELETLEIELKLAREKAKPDAEKQARTYLDKQSNGVIKAAKESVESAKSSFEDLRIARMKLAQRIAELKQTEPQRQQLQDELNVLREIQIEVLRRRTLSELGIESIPAITRTEIDPKVEALLKDLRREVEVLRAELEVLRKK